MSAARGTVIKRGTTFTVVLDLGRDEAGKRMRQWHSGYRTKKAAEAARTDLLSKLDAGVSIKVSELTLREFTTRTWLPGLDAGKLRETTVAMYRRSANSYLLPKLGSTKLKDLSPVRLKAWIDGLRAEGVGARTIEIAYVSLHKALKEAVDLELIPRNPADNSAVRAAKPPVTKPELAEWTGEQSRAFLDSQREDRLYALWRLAIMTGLRRGELCGLRWRDVDLEVGEIHVRETSVVVGYKVVQSEPKTAKSRRTVGLDDTTVAALRSYRARQSEEMLAFGRPRTDETPVFTREDGTPFHPQRFTQMLAAKAKAAKLPVVRLHALRHGHATAGLEAGVPLKVMSERLGHSSIAITADIYQRVTAATDHVAAAQVAAAIDGSA